MGRRGEGQPIRSITAAATGMDMVAAVTPTISPRLAETWPHRTPASPGHGEDTAMIEQEAEVATAIIILVLTSSRNEDGHGEPATPVDELTTTAGFLPN